MMSRRTLLAAAAALPLGAAARTPHHAPSDARDSLRNAAAACGLTYGCAVARYELEQDDFRAALLRESGMLVAEYEMKRNVLEPAEGRYDFAAADALVGFAGANGLTFRGHPLVWYRSNPAWLEPAVRATRSEALMTDYIVRVMGRYRGRISSWDVVNEALAPDDGRPDNLRDSFWLQALGPGYIDTAFHAARAADPKAQLVYNDWGCELTGVRYDRYRAATLKFLEGLKARGVPLDALGLQGHLRAYGVAPAGKTLAAFLDEVRALGLRVLVTEHDVDDSGGPLDIAARDAAVAETSARFLDVVTANPATDAVLTWGLTDRFLDPPDLAQRLIGYRPRRLPLDRALRRKPMWGAVRRALAEHA